jgi:hypothetical protein
MDHKNTFGKGLNMNYSEMFKQTTDNVPFHYQTDMTERPTLPSLLEVPTGMGKTAAAGWG